VEAKDFASEIGELSAHDRANDGVQTGAVTATGKHTEAHWLAVRGFAGH
jgi:hypothetical protein